MTQQFIDSSVLFGVLQFHVAALFLYPPLFLPMLAGGYMGFFFCRWSEKPGRVR